MAKARFYIKDKAQDVGYRAFILVNIFNFGLNGAPRNLPDGRVEVIVEGERVNIEALHETLKKEKPEIIEKSSITELEFNEDLIVPERMEAVHAFTLEQLSRGITFIIRMDERMEKGLTELGDKMEKGFTELGDKMEKGFTELGDKMDNLPERIAKALKGSK